MIYLNESPFTLRWNNRAVFVMLLIFLYCEIFGRSSRIFHNINSITFNYSLCVKKSKYFRGNMTHSCITSAGPDKQKVNVQTADISSHKTI